MKRIAIILCITYAILCGNVTSTASVKDTVSSNNNIFIECFGHSLSFLSANYEHNFYSVTNYLRFSCRSGIGWVPGYNKSDSSRAHGIVSVPIVLSCHLNYKNFSINFSAGYTGSFGRKWEDLNRLVPRRFDGYESSFVLSIGFRYSFRNAFWGFYPYYVFEEPLGFRNKSLSAGFYGGVHLRK